VSWAWAQRLAAFTARDDVTGRARVNKVLGQSLAVSGPRMQMTLSDSWAQGSLSGARHIGERAAHSGEQQGRRASTQAVAAQGAATSVAAM